jgi:drug/metabolite transporter (DMT)-like permease
MLLTALCGAIYGILAQRMLSRYSALAVTMYAMLFGTFLLFPAVLLEGLPQTFIQIDGKIAILILFLGIFGGALAFYLWTFALTRLTPTQVAVYVNVNPMVAIILGAILLAEKLTGAFVVGFVAVVVGVLFVNWPRRIESE